MRISPVFVVYLLAPQILFSQETPEGPASREEPDTVRPSVVNYSADDIEYIPSEGNMLLFGKAQVKYQDIIVEADRIQFQSKSREVFAYGSPILRSAEDTLYGDRMGYHLDQRRGFVENGKTRIEKGWFTGRLIRLVGTKTFNVDDGTFTTCDHNPPHYRFVSKKMKVYANDMVVCEPVVLEVRRVPLLPVPFWFFPIKKGRHSGFLIPQVGKSSTEGRYVKRMAYYWVTNDYSDVTLGFSYFEKQGPRIEVEGVYLLKPVLAGQIGGSFIDEHNTDTRRWRFNASHQQSLKGGISLKGEADFQSDASYNVDYEEETIVQLNKQMRSYLSLSKSYSGAIAQMVFDRTRDFQKDVTTEKVPEARFSTSSRPIFSPAPDEPASWYHSLYWNYRGLAVNSRERAESLAVHQGLDNFLTLESPQKLFTYLTLSPRLSLRETVYDRDTLGTRYSLRHHYTASTALSTVLYGLSRGGVGMVEQLRHIVRPSLTYSYAPEIEQSRYYTFPEIGGVSATNNLTASLANDFQVRLRWGEETRKLDLASLNLATSYNLKAQGKRLSNISSTLEIKPARFLNVRANASHDPYTGDLESLRLTTALALGGGSGGGASVSPWRLSLNHDYTWDPEGAGPGQVWGGAGFNPTKNWRLDYTMRYDLTEGQVVERRLYLYRDLHCWEADFTWSSYGDRWRYDFKIRIKAVPEIRLGKGILGLFLP